MHILHLEFGRNLYGGALQVLYLMQGLKKRGCRNTLLCTEHSAIAEAAADAAAEICRFPLAGELDPLLPFHLGRSIRAVQPDILHVHSRRGADLWGGIAASMWRIKAVVSRRVDNPEPAWLARLKYQRYARVIAISEGIRRVLLAEGVPAAKTVCVPSAVDHRFYQGSCNKTWFRRQFGLNNNERTIGVIAQLIQRKGHRYLIAAAPSIVRGFPNIRFIFFGRGPLQSELERLCREAKISDKVCFAGFRSDLEQLLPCLDLVVHPATLEGLGVSLLQAAASGLPIVASRVGGLPEIVRHGRNGYLVPAANPVAIAEAVSALLKDPLLAQRFGQAGREMVRSNFSLEAMVAGNLAVYQAVLAE